MSTTHMASLTTVQPDPPSSLTGMSIEEMTESLTGFEEIAVAKAFGKELTDLPGTQPLRALVMIWHKRTDDLDDKAAYEKAMDVSLKDCLGFFEADDEITPTRPETAPGKGSSLPA